MEIFRIYLLFWLFSILGWIMETIVCSYYEKKFVNRGFLLGPYCPIYGSGALILLFLAPYKDSPFVCFVLALVLCTVLEYLTSFIMEKIFHVRWWDYSNDHFNINGRVCLRNAIAFGALGVLFTRYMCPLFNNIYDKISSNNVVVIVIIIFIVTCIDIVISVMAMESVKKIVNKNIKNYINKDSTNDIKKIVFKDISYLEERIIRAYHLLEKKIESKIDKSYKILLLYAILGIFVGVILCLLFKLDGVKVISFTFSVSVLIAIVIIKVKK